MVDNAILSKPLIELELPYRAWKCLDSYGFKTVNDVLSIADKWPISGIRAFKGIGEKAAGEISRVIADFITESIDPRAKATIP